MTSLDESLLNRIKISCVDEVCTRGWSPTDRAVKRLLAASLEHLSPAEKEPFLLRRPRAIEEEVHFVAGKLERIFFSEFYRFLDIECGHLSNSFKQLSSQEISDACRDKLDKHLHRLISFSAPAWKQYVRKSAFHSAIDLSRKQTADFSRNTKDREPEKPSNYSHENTVRDEIGIEAIENVIPLETAIKKAAPRFQQIMLEWDEVLSSLPEDAQEQLASVLNDLHGISNALERNLKQTDIEGFLFSYTEGVLSNAEIIRFCEALDDIPSETWLLFFLRFVLGLKCSVILQLFGSLWGPTEGAIRARTFYVRNRMYEPIRGYTRG